MTAFALLLFAYTLSQFYRAFLAVVAADLSRDLGLGPADLGLMSAAWFASFAFAQFPVGWCLDRFGPRLTIAGFMSAAVLGAAGLAAAQGRGGALGAMALIGLGCSPVLMGGLYLFARNAPGRFAMLSSLFIGLGNAGNLLAATPLAFAVETLGWRGAMLGLSGITALSAVLSAALLADPPRLSTGSAHASLWRGLRAVARIRALWLILPLTAVSYAVVIAERSLWIAPFLRDVHGFDGLARGNAAFAMALAMAAGALAYGPVERWVGSPKATTLAGSLLTGGAFVTLGLFGGTSAGLAVALLTLVGAAGLTYGILMAHARLFFPAELLGRGVTFMNFAFIGGAGLIQALSGPFVERSMAAGLPPDAIFSRLHLAFGLALLLAAALYALAPNGPAARTTPV